MSKQLFGLVVSITIKKEFLSVSWHNQGIEKGKEECIGIFILDNMEEGKSKVQIIKKLIIRFNLPEKDAERLMDKYMNNVNSTR